MSNSKKAAAPTEKAEVIPAEATTAETTPVAPGETAVSWDESSMSTHFSNALHIQSTMEQVDLFFGTNLSWNGSGDGQVKIRLDSHIILAPHAAKRLWMTLGNVMKEYETQHGALKIQQ